MKIKALIVEDEDAIRELLADELGNYGCKVQQAESGATALELVRATVPDIIFVDVIMPQMDGFELVEKLRENPKTADVPVVLVTGVNAHGSHERAKELDIRHHITKPWEPWALEKVLKEATGMSFPSADRYQVYPPSAGRDT